MINLNHFTCSDQAILIEAHNILERWDVDEDFMTEDTILQAITEAASCWNRTPEDTEEMVQCLAQDFPFAD